MMAEHKRPVHLWAFLQGIGFFPGGWRHPGATPSAVFERAYYQRLARMTDDARFDAIVFGDQLQGRDAAGRTPGRLAAPTLDPFTLLAVMADKPLRGGTFYRTLLIWPYAIAPPVVGVLWVFMLNPSLGIIAHGLRAMGIDWNPLLNGTQAAGLIILAAAWKQISYNFLFFLAGLQAIPSSLIEAAAIDGARPARRFWTVIFPLLSPTIFFLIVVNVVYAFFDTFGIIDTMTRGGPAKATETLVYKVYVDGLLGGNLGGSAAQSVILMVIVIALTAIQFRFVERKVNY